MKKLLKLLTNKFIITFISFLAEVTGLVLLTLYVSQFSVWIYAAFKALSFLLVFAVINRDANPSYKLALVVPILAFSLFGGIIYLFMGRPRTGFKQRKRIRRIEENSGQLMAYTNDLLHIPTQEFSDDAYKLVNYVRADSGFPCYGYTATEYYPLGEDFYKALVDALRKAEKFVFMEYFIYEDGKFWGEVSDILCEKARAGVDVRMIYDDVGSLFTLKRRDKKKLTAAGIKIMGFNKMMPSFDIRLNNRTHRKITVIDGNVSFTGGVNLADEYINEKERFGHWKDTAMKFTGPATWSFTMMFLAFWELEHDHETDYIRFAPTLPTAVPEETKGYVQPLADRPGQNLQLMENTFLSLINNADRYVYINTPYLILDNELSSALCLAAKSGVDVRITVPHIPDKKIVFMMTRSFYPQLLKAGVKIYEYTPGFVHAKSVVVDDTTAYIGSCNFDYRSLYLHFECGALLYNTPTVADMHDDFLATLEKCEAVTYEKTRNANVFVRLARSLLRLFSPLL